MYLYIIYTEYILIMTCVNSWNDGLYAAYLSPADFQKLSLASGEDRPCRVWVIGPINPGFQSTPLAKVNRKVVSSSYFWSRITVA